MNHRQFRPWFAALAGLAMNAANAWGQGHGEAEDAQLRSIEVRCPAELT